MLKSKGILKDVWNKSNLASLQYTYPIEPYHEYQ